MQVELFHIEMALRRQFAWEPGADKWLNPRTLYFVKGKRMRVPGTKKVGLCVFIGLTHLHNIEQAKTCAWLGITQRRYDQMLDRYEQSMRERVAAIKKNEYQKYTPFSKIVFTKSRLVQSYLMAKHNAPPVNFFRIFSAKLLGGD